LEGGLGDAVTQRERERQRQRQRDREKYGGRGEEEQIFREEKER
jgi:hypothetical protein